MGDLCTACGAVPMCGCRECELITRVEELEREADQLQAHNSQLLDDCRIVKAATLDRVAEAVRPRLDKAIEVLCRWNDQLHLDWVVKNAPSGDLLESHREDLLTALSNVQEVHPAILALKETT